MPAMTSPAWVVSRHPRSDEITLLLHEVNDFADIPSGAVMVYLDDTDHSSEPGVAEDFRYPGLFLSAHVGTDTPQPVREAILTRGECEFIWLSKGLLDGPVGKIVWVYAHELRHVMQKADSASVTLLAPVLQQYQSLSAGQQFKNLDKPEELDCELFAQRCISAVLGPDALARHIAGERLVAIGAAYFDRLESIAQHVERAGI